MGKYQNPVRQANWQKVGGVSPLERRSNRTTFLREPCVGSREGAGEASVVREVVSAPGGDLAAQGSAAGNQPDDLAPRVSDRPYGAIPCSP